MRTTRWWWGMLCIAGMACSGDGPPLGAVAREVGGDLEFVLPAVRGNMPILESVELPDAADAPQTRGGDTALAVMVDESADLTEGTPKTTAQFPMIFSTDVTSRFNGSRLELTYGMTGFGTGYSMIPSLELKTFAGEKLGANVGAGRSEDSPIPWRFKPVALDFVPLHRDCGMLSDLVVNFEGRMRTIVAGTSREQQAVRSTAHAQQCPIYTTAGGGGGGGTSYTITICSYEAVFDSWGNLVDVFFLGCVSYPTGSTTRMT